MNLEERIKIPRQEEYIGRILVPTEQVIELRKGQKRTSSRKFYPGYILVQMVLYEKTWHTVRNTAKVTGFVGGDVKPAPIPDEEAEGIIRQMEEGLSRPKPKYQFEEGDEVRVIDGPFSNFQGIVDEIKMQYGIEPGETTTDKRFSLEILRCLGCCAIAPVLTVDGKVYGRVKQTEVQKLLEKYI